MYFAPPALNGTQPSEYFADFGFDTRQFSRARLNCLRRVAYSSHTSCTVALPMRTPSHFEYPAVSFCRSNPLSHSRRSRIARLLVSLQSFHT